MYTPKNLLIFMSGKGSNAEILIKYSQNTKDCAFKIVGLVTDRPSKCRANEIGMTYNLPVLAVDIFDFYLKHGEENIGLINERRKEIRDLWTKELQKEIINSGLEVDFILLAGFEPLSNITCDYIALNIHPGDLTIEKNNLRILNGLGIKPIEIAIVEGINYLRSSVIIAQAYTGLDSDIDAGPILGVSEKMAIDYQGYNLKFLQEQYRNRPQKLVKGFCDNLREVARFNLARLKEEGDHIVFPRAVDDYAKGLFEVNGEQLSYKNTLIKTVEYSENSQKLIFETTKLS